MSDATNHRDVEIEDDDASLDDTEQDFVLPPKGGLSRLAMAFAIGLLAAGTFTGGVLVQKHHDKSLTSSSRSGLPAGLGTGSLPAGFPGSITGGATTGSGTAATAGGGGGATTGLAVVGSVVSVSGTRVTVKDLGGKTHDVQTTTATTVTRSQTQSLSSLAAGTQVTVTGTTATDGTVTATAITAH